MRVASFTSHVHWSFHYETELELLERHLRAGDAVTQIACGASLASCDTNPDHTLARCASCIGRRLAGLGLLEGNVRVVDWRDYLTAENRREIACVPAVFPDLAALRGFTLEKFPAGMGVASSLISITRDPDVAMPKHALVVGDLLRSCVGVYRAIQNFTRIERPDRIYAFNGRYAHTRAVLAACDSMGVECVLHERGATKDHYALFFGHLPHDTDARERMIREAWLAAPPVERERVAANWYERRALGEDPDSYMFVHAQIADKLPAGWDRRKKNIAIFTSSEDENEAISDDWRDFVYTGQLEGIRLIAGALMNHSEYNIYVRVHPNLARVDNQRKRAALSLGGPNTTVILPESEVSSYALMRAADRVISFGSTVSIEAAYWGAVSILTAQALWRNLGATHNPGSHEELMQLLLGPTKPCPNEGALMFGYYCATYGQRFDFYKPESAARGEFKGHNLLLEPELAQPWRAVNALSSRRGFRRAFDLASRLHRRAVRRRLVRH